jgi:HEAT repeat protein
MIADSPAINESFPSDVIPLQEILDDLHSGNVDKFDLAMHKLQNLPGVTKQKTIDEIQPFLSNSDPEKRCDAIELLLMIDQTYTLERVLALLNDPVDYVRFFICREFEFHSIEDNRIINPLASSLLNDSDPDVRYQAAIILGEIGNSEVIPALEWAVANDQGVNYEGDSISSRARWAINEINK